MHHESQEASDLGRRRAGTVLPGQRPHGGGWRGPQCPWFPEGCRGRDHHLHSEPLLIDNDGRTFRRQQNTPCVFPNQRKVRRVSN